jgi:lipoprotein-anchoring transpeptidase ErfK/SrfK/peptidoglycan hydrolase-like protein with peptidoglycan-binding domain
MPSPEFVRLRKIRPADFVPHVSHRDWLGKRDFHEIGSSAYLALVLIAVCISLPLQVWSQQSESASRAPAPNKSATTTAVTRKRTELQVSKINDPNNRDPVGTHSEGDGVIRAAILLDRLKFSPGEISKSYGNNLAKAIRAFQSASGLPSTGNVDSTTWAALNKDQGTKGQVEQKQVEAARNPPHPQENSTQQPQTAEPAAQPHSSSVQNREAPGQKRSQAGKLQQPAPPESDVSQTMALTTYIIALEDVAGPFVPLPRLGGRDAGERLMLREARLARLNYESALQLLAEKFHASPRLLVELNAGKRFNKAGEKITVPNVLTPEPAPAASVTVDGAGRSVTAFDSGGKILAFYPATVGSEHDPLPVGDWTVDEVSWYPKFKYNPQLFWDAENKNPRATLPPGPKNPVGVVWIGLSKKHYGIHGTPNPSLIGVTQSHGCVRLTNWDAAELGKIVRVGTPAILKEGGPVQAKRQPQASTHSSN